MRTHGGMRRRMGGWAQLTGLGLCVAGIWVLMAGSGRTQEKTPAPAALLSTDEAEQAQPVYTPAQQEVVNYAVDQAHAACFEDDPFPSAKKCAVCHPVHFREWSVSPHAYAQISPVFNAMSNKLRKLTNGTMGDFCIRCHTPVGMSLDEPIDMTTMDRHPAAREGITCVVCHRINQAWGKGAGRQALVAGNINQVVYGPLGSEILNQVLASPDQYGVLKTNMDPNIRGREVHSQAVRFFYLTTPAFCGACHDVFAPTGLRLEDAFSEYKMSPSAHECGETCQDCHMGAVSGEALGYETAPAAVLGNTTTPPRKHTNHMIAGPDYPIVHRGIFPHHRTAIREEWESREAGLATMREWLIFDDAGGWGTEEFEANVPEGAVFPAPWDDPSMRKAARAILDEQYDLLSEYTQRAVDVLRAGFKMSRVQVDRADTRKGLDLRVKVWNGTNGHSVPTGFDAERLVFLRVLVWDPNGRLVYQSGDLDPNGDVRDNHSLYVHNGEIPLDRQIFTLQTRFITLNARGGEREQVLPIPFSLTALPFLRPARRPFTVLGRPISARKQKRNIEPRGHRWANYDISPKNLTCSGTYTIQAQLIAGMVPVNLIHTIEDVGFDYGMSARDVADGVVNGHLVLWQDVQQINVD